MWPHKNYPNYCYGMGYVISFSLLHCINSHVSDENSFYYMPIEDMSTGIHISTMCNVLPTNVFKWQPLAKAVWENNESPEWIDFANFEVYHEVKEKKIFDRLWNTEKDSFKRSNAQLVTPTSIPTPQSRITKKQKILKKIKLPDSQTRDRIRDIAGRKM